LCVSTAWATTFTVTNTNDSGPGSLRAAIEQANANAGADEIVFSDGASGTMTLASTLPDPTDEAGLAIDGGGDVTVSGNKAVGIIRGYGKPALRNLTLVEGGFPERIGATDRRGGAIYNHGTLEITNVTLSDNRITGSWPEGSAIYNQFGTLTVSNTILANNTATEYGGNCAAVDVDNPTTDGGYNIEDGDTCGFTQDTGSLSNTNPILDPPGLQDNGGPTLTVGLQPDSPAVDFVGQDACPPPTTDQRGVGRPQEEACDSGAFELVQQPTAPDSDGDRVASVSQWVASAFSAASSPTSPERSRAVSLATSLGSCGHLRQPNPLPKNR
jgi:hypothetical protein